MIERMDRPRLLLVPDLTEVEWLIRPQLEEWADVACFDAPGVGEEPGAARHGPETVARRALEEIARRGWDTCVVVADEFAVPSAVEVAAAAPQVVSALVLGHARLANSFSGPRPSMNREVFDACASMVRTDPRTFVRQMFKMTGGESSAGGYGENLVDRYMSRVPTALMAPTWDAEEVERQRIGDVLRTLDVPMLLARHEGCLVFTPEGFDDAVAALPHARAVSLDEKPSTSPEFSEVLKDFCATLTPARA